MPLKLPHLDDTSYRKLVDEMIAAIPRYSGDWNNYNASDPGITIIELLAYVASTLLYRIDRVSNRAYLNYLRLLAGAAGREGRRLLEEERRSGQDPDYIALLECLERFEAKAVETWTNEDLGLLQSTAYRYIRRPYRGVTEKDFHGLVLEALDLFRQSRAFGDDVVGLPSESFALYDDAAAEVQIILLAPDQSNDLIHYDRRVSDNSCEYRRRPAETNDTFEACSRFVGEYLAPRRLIGTRLRVGGPRYSAVDVTVRVVCEMFYARERVLADVCRTALQYLDPLEPPEQAARRYGAPVRRNLFEQTLKGVRGVGEVLDSNFAYADDRLARSVSRAGHAVPVEGFLQVRSFTAVHVNKNYGGRT